MNEISILFYSTISLPLSSVSSHLEKTAQKGFFSTLLESVDFQVLEDAVDFFDFLFLCRDMFLLA